MFDLKLPEVPGWPERKENFDFNRSYESYAFYRKTKAWRRKAGMVRARDRRACLKCGVTTRQLRAKGLPPLHVHHGTYSDIGNERPEQLFTLCRSCHFELHRAHKASGDGNLMHATVLFLSRKPPSAPLLGRVVIGDEQSVAPAARMPAAGRRVSLLSPAEKKLRKLRQRWNRKLADAGLPTFLGGRMNRPRKKKNLPDKSKKR